MAQGTNDIKGYRWETGYEKSWYLYSVHNFFSMIRIFLHRHFQFREEIKEGEDGLGIAAISESLALLEQRRKAQQNGKIVRLGMMRHLNVILDCSDAMLDQDLKPTRQMCTLKVIRHFYLSCLQNGFFFQYFVFCTAFTKIRQRIR